VPPAVASRLLARIELLDSDKRSNRRTSRRGFSALFDPVLRIRVARPRRRPTKTCSSVNRTTAHSRSDDGRAITGSAWVDGADRRFRLAMTAGPAPAGEEDPARVMSTLLSIRSRRSILHSLKLGKSGECRNDVRKATGLCGVNPTNSHGAGPLAVRPIPAAQSSISTNRSTLALACLPNLHLVLAGSSRTLC
jgi:hypothetical protein